MKEATGELNATIIVILGIAALAAFFFSVIWPRMNESMQLRSKCADAICDIGYNKNYMAYCYNPGTPNAVYECPYRG